jgi:hypothetical protein
MALTAKQVVKFSLLVGLGAIFIDAAIAHGLFWDNDPYWTYWITKTFLITTVFLLGTAWLGAGIWQGLVLTAVHTAILEVYYQWLAPVGLPQEPEWLDFNHLWVTGVPAHYLAILAGYFLALWLWRRNATLLSSDGRQERASAYYGTGAFSLYALAVTVVILVLDGIITQGILLQDFPGITFFVQHLLVGFVFVAAWTAYAGPRDVQHWVIGSLLLALIWVTYSMYLGPRGLPLEPPVYSGYNDLWWRAFPGAFVSALVGWWLCSRFISPRLFASVAAALFLSAVVFAPDISWAQAPLPVEKGTNALHASARASGAGVRVVGPDPVDLNSTQPVDGTIAVETWEMGNRWSHVQNTDAMRVAATFTSNGAQYEVTIDKPMPRHPLGQYTTWSGVVYDHEMHGDTGIGTGKLPKMRPDIALWGWAEVKRDGQVLAKMAPAHVMVTSQGTMPGIMLEINTEDRALAGEPDGYINVMWHNIEALQLPTAQANTRLTIGWIALIGAALLFGILAWRAPASPRESA